MQVKRAMDVTAASVENVPGVTIRWLWATPDGAPTFALRLFEVQAGASTPYHTYPYEHEMYILSGQAILRGEAQEYLLAAGDTALVLLNEKHQLVNNGTDVLRFLCAIPLPRESIGVTAQVSLYSLRQEHLSLAIDAAIDVFSARELEVQPGAMSRLIAGDSVAVWTALRDAFAAAARGGETVMVVAVSNACPLPSSQQ